MNGTKSHGSFRILLGGGAVLLALVYLIQAWARHRIFWLQGGLILQTDAYEWIWVPSLRSVLALIELAGFLVLLLWPESRRSGVPRLRGISAPPEDGNPQLGPVMLGVAAVTIVLAPALIVMQVLKTDDLFAAQWAAALMMGLPVFWLLYRPHQGQMPVARLGAWAARGGGPALPWAAAAAGAVVMIVSWWGVYRSQPIITDTQSQIAQARLLLGGHWRLDISQALRDVICFPYATRTVPSYSQYPPGYILPLMGVLALRLPAQALDVATAALMAWAAFVLARRVAGRAAAVAAIPLLMGSPFFMALSGSGMNHSLCAALLAVAAVCFVPGGTARARGAGVRRGMIGGLCLGWVAMTRPVTALAQGVVWTGFWIADCGLRIKNSRADKDVRAPRVTDETSALEKIPHSAFRIPHFIGIALGAALPAAIFLYYNYRTTGHPLVMGYQVSNHELHRLGFHAGFTPGQAWNRLAANLCSLNFQLFGWVFGSWVLMGVWLARSGLGRAERALAAIILTQTGLYAIYQFHDLMLGPRFLYELLPAFVVLGAAGLAPSLRRGGARGGTVLTLIVLLSLGGLAEGYRNWVEHLAGIASRHVNLERAIRAKLPLRGPTVMIVDRQEGEMIGRHFEWGKLWFVEEGNEAAARKLPELAGWNWMKIGSADVLRSGMTIRAEHEQEQEREHD